jgi:flagellar biogenesis protein FliO
VGAAAGGERSRGSFAGRVLHGFDQLPAVRLPLGPAIPWRVAIPVLVVVVAAMVFVTRTSSTPGSPLPAPTPTVQPLFANAEPDVSVADQAATEVAALQPPDAAGPAGLAGSAPRSIGVQEPAGMGFDVLDVGLKLVAVLALAYGSLILLKRTGFGGAAVSTGGSPALGMRMISSLVLAPNRTVHLLKVPGGKTLLLGATPNQVNLIVDLGALPDDQDADPEGSFFDVLKGKISS